MLKRPEVFRHRCVLAEWKISSDRAGKTPYAFRLNEDLLAFSSDKFYIIEYNFENQTF